MNPFGIPSLTCKGGGSKPKMNLKIGHFSSICRSGIVHIAVCPNAVSFPLKRGGYI